MPKFNDNKFKNVLKNKDQIFDIMKIVDNSINGITNIKKHFGAGINVIKNEVKDIMKVIKSLENRGVLLKGTARKVTSQEGGFLSFLRQLMTAGLPLLKNVFIPLVKTVLLPLGLSAGMSAADAAIQKKIYGSGTTELIYSNEKREDVMKMIKSIEKS